MSATGALDRPEPWTAGQVRLLAGTHALGVLVLVGVWGATSRGSVVSNQLGWAAVGVVALTVLLAVDGLWLLLGHRAIGLARRALIDPYGPPFAVVKAAPADERLVINPVTRRLHRATCTLVRERPVRAATAAAMRRLSPRLCDVCGPSEGEHP